MLFLPSPYLSADAMARAEGLGKLHAGRCSEMALGTIIACIISITKIKEKIWLKIEDEKY